MAPQMTSYIKIYEFNRKGGSIQFFWYADQLSTTISNGTRSYLVFFLYTGHMTSSKRSGDPFDVIFDYKIFMT